MTPTEKIGLIKSRSFIEWTSLVGCKAKPRQLSRHQYIVTHVSDVLSFRSRVKLITPQVTLRRWDNGPTLKRYPVGHLDRYCLYAGNGGKSISLTALLDNYDLFHATGKPVEHVVQEWGPVDHTRDTRDEGRVHTYVVNDSVFLVQVADLFRSMRGLGVSMFTYQKDDRLLVDFKVTKRARKFFFRSISNRTGLLEPWPTPSLTD